MVVAVVVVGSVAYGEISLSAGKGQKRRILRWRGEEHDGVNGKRKTTKRKEKDHERVRRRSRECV